MNEFIVKRTENGFMICKTHQGNATGFFEKIWVAESVKSLLQIIGQILEPPKPDNDPR